MKEGWTYKKLGDVFVSINNGANIKQIKGASGIPITRIETLSNDMFNRDRMGYANIDNVSPYTSYVLNEGDILMSHINSMKFLGRAVAYVKKDEETIIHGMNLLRLVPTSDVLSPFMVYQFQTKYFRNQILQISHQSVNQASFNTTNLKGLNVMVPSLSEQQSIVDYLDSAFAKIDAMKANAEKALGEAKALFQASLKEMLEPKEGWEEKTLGSIAEDSADGPFGSNLKKEHYTTKKEVRIIQLSNIGEDGWREENTKYTTFEHLKNISRSEVEPNDIVIAKMMPAGRAILCPSHEAKFVLSSDAVKIKLKKGMLTRFILHSINSPYFRNEVYENVTGSGRVRTSLTKLRACSIYLPSLEVQQSIVDTLDSLKSKVDRLQENYDKISQECDALKQAILRQVFE